MKHRLTLLTLVLVTLGCSADAPPADSEPVIQVTPAPPGTDIWLATLSGEGSALRVGTPTNVTARPGYDNQPHFLPDGTGFWYTAIDEAGQADIRRYDLTSGRSEPVTTTAPESEYSATPLEGAEGFSAIRVEADSTQRLWRFANDGSGASVIFPDIAPVGYHAWADERTAVLFVLGEPATLHVADLASGTSRVAATDIGRSIRRIPGTHDVSFVQRRREGTTDIRRLRHGSGESETVAPGVESGDFHAWTPDGTLLQAHEARLFAWGPEGEWRQVADFSDLGLRLTRLAVSPDGQWIALVAEVLD